MRLPEVHSAVIISGGQWVKRKLCQLKIEPNMIKSTSRFLLTCHKLCFLVGSCCQEFLFCLPFWSVPWEVFYAQSWLDVEPSRQRWPLMLSYSFHQCLILHRGGMWGAEMIVEGWEGTAVCHIVNRDGCRSRPSWIKHMAGCRNQAELLKIEFFLLAPDLSNHKSRVILNELVPRFYFTPHICLWFYS